MGGPAPPRLVAVVAAAGVGGNGTSLSAIRSAARPPPLPELGAGDVPARPSPRRGLPGDAGGDVWPLWISYIPRYTHVRLLCAWNGTVVRAGGTGNRYADRDHNDQHEVHRQRDEARHGRSHRLPSVGDRLVPRQMIRGSGGRVEPGQAAPDPGRQVRVNTRPRTIGHG
jgi:hypothetical protein